VDVEADVEADARTKAPGLDRAVENAAPPAKSRLEAVRDRLRGMVGSDDDIDDTDVTGEAN
ncbi:MAG: hypothetical protein IBX53_10285, partial [Halomonas sp.]|uniref:hypothetical protein n=1 Tax=Halomonas sp. TaxID=1486246 RepID=UPI0019F190DE